MTYGHTATPDLTGLFAGLNEPLQRSVARSVQAPRELIEDACQLAWIQLLPWAGRLPPDRALAWLTTTASREALRSLRRTERERPLADVLGHPAAHGPAELVALRGRLGEMRALPDRQQRLLWLKGLGFSYTEIAAATGDSHRTIERQLIRARSRLRAA